MSYDFLEEDKKDTFDIIEEEKTSAKSLESNLINRFGNPNLKLQKINDVWVPVLKKSQLKQKEKNDAEKV